MTVRILHVVTDMNRGGIETMLMNYYRQINRNKIQFDFLVHRETKAEYDDEIESLGGQIYRMPRLNPLSLKYYNELSCCLKNNKYEIIHSHIDCMSAYPLKIAKKSGIPVRIAHAHSTNQDKNWKYPIKYISFRKIPLYATDYFACSEKAGKWMFPGHDFLVLKNAIDINKYVPNEKNRENIKKEFGIKNNSLVIGHVGRFSYPKNHSFLIDIFYCIKKYRPDSYLMLIGGGKDMINIRQKVKQLKLENNVIFTGLRSDVHILMQAMDIFVFPSIYEGLGMSVIEAQAAGLPCVISNEVPKECIVTQGLVSIQDLSMSADKWAKHILKRLCIVHKNHNQEIAESGYDIVEAAKWLEEYYVKKCNKEYKINNIYTSI